MNDADPTPTAEQACQAVINVALEERCPSGMTLSEVATEVLAALLRPSDKECEACGGTGEHWYETTDQDRIGPSPCLNPVCINGRVPTPSPIIDLLIERGVLVEEVNASGRIFYKVVVLAPVEEGRK